MLVNFIQDIHKSIPRDYMGRMNDNKVDCSIIARRFDKNFFDGSRRFGYGGYKDDGRWKKIAQKLVDKYKPTSVLDIGCGKGFLLRDIREITDCSICGYEVSDYCIENKVIWNINKLNIGKENIKEEFDLIISINTLHNLTLPELRHAIYQINEWGKQSYIVVESYRNIQELHNLQCWALTAECFFRPEEWEFLFKEWGYIGDWEFIYFE
jgi:SAM-dependent methyltransferase